MLASSAVTLCYQTGHSTERQQSSIYLLLSVPLSVSLSVCLCVLLVPRLRLPLAPIAATGEHFS